MGFRKQSGITHIRITGKQNYIIANTIFPALIERDFLHST
jgi:hypothetical protein